MGKSINQIQIFYEIAMSIGKSLDLSEMLRKALLSYLRKLNCVSGLVYRFNLHDNTIIRKELSFRLPFSDIPESMKKELDRLISETYSRNELKVFLSHLPLIGELYHDLYYHIFPLDDFGVLVLLKSRHALSREIVLTLREVNSKLAQACLACITNENLKKSREKARIIGEAAVDAIIMVDQKGHIEYWNKSAERIFGYTEEEMLGKNVHKFLAPSKYHSKIQEGWMKFITSGKGAAIGRMLELTALRKGGEEFPIEIALSTINDGKRLAALAYIRDISERKRVQKALEESEHKQRQNAERLELALLGSEAGLWDWNVLTGDVYFSDRWCSMLGYRKEEVQPDVSSWEKLVHPEDMPMVMEVLNDHLEQKTKLYKTEHRLQTKSGEWKWILSTGKVTQWDKNGQALRAVGTHIDITEKKLNEGLLRKNLEQQEILSEISLQLNGLDNFDIRINRTLEQIGRHTQVSRVYIFEDSQEGTITSNTYEWCNTGVLSQMEMLQDFPYEAIPSWRPILIQKGVLYSDRISELPDDIVEILEPQNIKSIVVYPLWVKGEFHGFIGFDECARQKEWNKSELELLRTLAGVIANAYERKIMEQDIIEERNRANRANQAKSEFLANMSHEIRTPLTAILGFSESLLYEIENPQQQKVLNSILSSGRLLLSLINDILDLSKIESGRLEISPHPTDLVHMLEEIRMLFLDKARKKGIEIHLNTPKDFPVSLRLDELRMKQVLFNLVSNAIKFTHKGFVSIGLDFRFNSDRAGNLTLSVSDTGIGIPTGEQERIFKAFVQQSGRENRLYEGTGLGLAISKRLINKMNGDIVLESQAGKGATFQVSIPDVELVPRCSENREEAEVNIIYEFEKFSLLVVDDVDANIEMVERLLHDPNILILTAHDGATALEILQHRKPDVVLLDIRMPGLSGYEVAEKIKKNSETEELPVIAFTASVFSAQKLKEYPFFDGVLFKPVRRNEFLKELARFVPHKKQLASQENDATKDQDVYMQNDLILTDKEMDKLSQIVNVLEDSFLPEWKSIVNPVVMYRIEEFANKLKELSQEYSINYIGDYSDQLLEDVESFDVEEVNRNLSVFPEIIENLKKQMPQKV